MEEKISKLIEKSKKNDKKSLLELVERFNPLINKYSRMLNYEDAKNDLTEHFIVTIKQMPLMTEAKELNYIKTSVKNNYIKLSKNLASYKHSIFLNDQMELFKSHEKVDELSLDLRNALDLLEERERYIIYYRYILGYSDSEISKKELISRQAVHKTRKKALISLNQTLGGDKNRK